ncbi:MAG: hypothetical protein AVDCRST_MAG66-1579 [uncultured Pseudonocardia sp.]|uniref:Uncharacterized protein n=1 Tax=uncultured Pseudonocardia sp. TaxID=211455 RepID=A0A6J4P3F2_9PSEU|nr:MAG: hypothetical protein AVDCRST_MAG66-1579 [uncultured Pseudonocardia sp.]
MLLPTFGVLVVLLVVQGLSLPAVIRFSGVGQDPAGPRAQAGRGRRVRSGRDRAHPAGR